MAIPLRVLIVEDNPDDAELIILQLKQAGFQPDWQRVETEADYLSALALPPELILSDWSLPRFSGLAALRLLTNRNLDIPFVLVSGSVGEETAIDALHEGADDYVLKDRPARLGESVHRALADKQLREKRQQAEKALREAEQKYRTIFDGAVEGIFQSTSDGRIITANPALARMWGYDTPEKLVSSITDVASQVYIDPQRRDEFSKIMEENGEVHGFEYQARRRDGTPMWASESARAVCDASGTLLYYEGSIEDITESKRAGEALRQSEERNRALLEALPDLIFVFNRQNVFIDYSSTNNNILLMPPSTFIGRNISEVLPPELADLTRHHVEQVFETGQIQVYQYSLLFGNEIRYFESRLVLKGSDEALSMVRDITERKRAEEKLSEQLKQLQLLRAIDAAIISNVDLDSNLQMIVQKTIEQLRMDAAVILLLDPKTQMLNFAAGEGFHTNALQFTSLKIGEGTAGRAAQEQKTIHISNLQEANINPTLTQAIKDEGFIAYYGIPLIAKDQLLGVLEIFHRSPLPADPDWLSFLETLAGQASISIDNANLFSDLQKSNMEIQQAYDATLEGWSHALDLRDKETEGHTQRVTELAVKLARAMGLSEEELLHIKRGALLHDIGKMGIPDSILLKPDKLTEDEWIIMRKHPVYAQDMLSHIEYLKPVLDIPYCHHEKWDGTGYPRGLKGEQIPLAARIFAVVDVWDAIQSDRSYNIAWSREKAIQHMHEQAGGYFDARIVEVFLREVECVKT